jgi:hypothetical protein
MIEHKCSFDEMEIQHDPSCPACKAEQAAPEMYECIASFVRRFGVAVECDEEINGGDAVDWIAENMPEFRNALKKARGVN